MVKVQTCPDEDGATKDRMVTAEDFEYGILRALKPETASNYAYVLGFAIKGADEYNSGDITDATRWASRRSTTRRSRSPSSRTAAYNVNIIGLWTAHA